MNVSGELSRLRHIGQVAEATLYAAPATEELTKPPGLCPDGGHGDFLRRATRGVHGNVSCILGHNSKAGRDCGHVFVGQPVVSILCPEWLEEEPAFTYVETLEELLGLFLPTLEEPKM